VDGISFTVHPRSLVRLTSGQTQGRGCARRAAAAVRGARAHGRPFRPLRTTRRWPPPRWDGHPQRAGTPGRHERRAFGIGSPLLLCGHAPLPEVEARWPCLCSRDPRRAGLGYVCPNRARPSLSWRSGARAAAHRRRDDDERKGRPADGIRLLG
jgi:hypothetical protein